MQTRRRRYVSMATVRWNQGTRAIIVKEHVFMMNAM